MTTQDRLEEIKEEMSRITQGTEEFMILLAEKDKIERNNNDKEPLRTDQES